MVTELKQKRIWDKRHFQLVNDGIKVRLKSPRHDVEVKVKYEELGFEISYIKKKEASWVFTVLMFLGILTAQFLLKNSKADTPAEIIILTLIGAFVVTIVTLAWLDTRKPLTVLEGGNKQIALLSNSPYKEKVTEFIEEVHNRMRENLIKKHVRPEDPSVDAKHKKYMLDQLLNQDIISDEKHKEVLLVINSLNPEKSVIGFNKLNTEE